MDWVAGAAKSSGRPSVASISIAGDIVDAVNAATANLVSSGVTTVVASGNDGKDAADVSPASTPSAITVGGVDSTDRMLWYSNFGSVVDVLAPGMRRPLTVLKPI